MKPFRIYDVTKTIRKCVVAGSMDELLSKSSEKLDIPATEVVTVVREDDGALIEDDDYLACLPNDTPLVILCQGEVYGGDHKKSFTSPSATVTSIFKPTSPSPSAAVIPEALFVPVSDILQSPQGREEKEVTLEAQRIVRSVMDNLIQHAKAQGHPRPFEGEVYDAGRSLALKYPCLRDNPNKHLDGNYTKVLKSLRRRMYNVTETQTRRGRKRKANGVSPDDTTAMLHQSPRRSPRKHTGMRESSFWDENDAGSTRSASRSPSPPRPCPDLDGFEPLASDWEWEKSTPGNSGAPTTKQPGKKTTPSTAANQGKTKQPGKKMTPSTAVNQGKSGTPPTKQPGKTTTPSTAVNQGKSGTPPTKKPGKKTTPSTAANQGKTKQPGKKTTPSTAANQGKSVTPATSQPAPTPSTRGVEDLKSLNKYSDVAKINHLLGETTEYRRNWIEAVPIRSRMRRLLEDYPVFQNGVCFVEEMKTLLPDKGQELVGVEQRLADLAEDVMQFSMMKGWLKTSIRGIDKGRLVLVSLRFLARILSPEKRTTAETSGCSLDRGQYLVHCTNDEDTTSVIGLRHKDIPTPYILIDVSKDKNHDAFIGVMVGDKLVMHVASSSDAVLTMMGIYYTLSMTYPPKCNGALLYLQHHIIQDRVHPADGKLLDKLSSEFSGFNIK